MARQNTRSLLQRHLQRVWKLQQSFIWPALQVCRVLVCVRHGCTSPCSPSLTRTSEIACVQHHLSLSPKSSFWTTYHFVGLSSREVQQIYLEVRPLSALLALLSTEKTGSLHPTTNVIGSTAIDGAVVLSQTEIAAARTLLAWVTTTPALLPWSSLF